MASLLNIKCINENKKWSSNLQGKYKYEYLIFKERFSKLQARVEILMKTLKKFTI